MGVDILQGSSLVVRVHRPLNSTEVAQCVLGTFYYYRDSESLYRLYPLVPSGVYLISLFETAPNVKRLAPLGCSFLLRSGTRNRILWRDPCGGPSPRYSPLKEEKQHLQMLQRSLKSLSMLRARNQACAHYGGFRYGRNHQELVTSCNQ